MQIRLRVVADRHVHARERLLHRRQDELTGIIQRLIRRQTRGARPLEGSGFFGPFVLRGLF